MHQTFYIDIDEEITSIVERLRKAKAKEVVIVVPKRALLIQSIVNLKLLKKEADELRKEVIIVTQDKFGKMLIEKAGILVEQKLDDVAGSEMAEIAKETEDEAVKIKIGSPKEDESETKSKNRLDKIGSTEYRQGEDLEYMINSVRQTQPEISRKKENKEEDGEKIINKELVVDVGNDLKRQKSSFGRKNSMDVVRNMEIIQKDKTENEIADKELDKKRKNAGQKFFKQEKMPDGKNTAIAGSGNKKAENFFQQQKKRNNFDEYKNMTVGGGFGKYFLAFGIIALIVILGAAGYLFLPKTTVSIFAKNKIQSVDAEIDGETNVSSADLEKEIIPIKTISITEELSRSYGATGSKTASNQKARGTVTIYNEYSSAPQPLVATTRLQSADGKIFRLVSGITVPGSRTVGGVVQPGAIEAEVVADEAGDAYNIAPATFTIPGFQGSGSEKYSKFYAKSFKPMSGGGNGSEAVKTVTDSDIAAAKAKVAQELKPVLAQKLKDTAGSDNVILDDAINTDDSTYTLSNSSGAVAENFTITVKTNATALIFKKEDVQNVILKLLAGKKDAKTNIDENSLNLEFGKSDADFKNGKIAIRVHGSVSVLPDIDLENLKKDIKGKNEAELKAYLSGYPEIGRVEVVYWPSFISGRISNYESRITVKLDKN